MASGVPVTTGESFPHLGNLVPFCERPISHVRGTLKGSES